MIKISNLKIGLVAFILLAILGVVFWQKTQTRDISEKNRGDFGGDGRVATASASDKINLQDTKKKTGFFPFMG